MFKTKKSVLKEIDRYTSRIDWHLRRLYRTRNATVSYTHLAPEVVTDGVLVALFFLLLLVGLHGAHDGLLHFLRRLLDGGLQRLHEGG